jgi:hypothetical protein
MLVFNNYFYKNRKSKLYFGDRVAVLNDFIYQTGGSIGLYFEISRLPPPPASQRHALSSAGDASSPSPASRPTGTSSLPAPTHPLLSLLLMLLSVCVGLE